MLPRNLECIGNKPVASPAFLGQFSDLGGAQVVFGTIILRWFPVRRRITSKARKGSAHLGKWVAPVVEQYRKVFDAVSRHKEND